MENLAAVSGSFASIALGQGLTDRKAADIMRTSEPPILDGVLDDPAWANATVIRDLHQYDPLENGVPSEESTFYLMYDDENLYVGARMYDSEPDQILARQLIQGQSVSSDDRLELILDPFNNVRAGYKFQVNATSIRTTRIGALRSVVRSRANRRRWRGPPSIGRSI
jgi:hypothetical protein